MREIGAVGRHGAGAMIPYCLRHSNPLGGYAAERAEDARLSHADELQTLVGGHGGVVVPSSILPDPRTGAGAAMELS